MSEERYVSTRSASLRKKWPSRECPNCGEYKHTDYERYKVVNTPEGWRKYIYTGLVLSLVLYPLAQELCEREWEKTYSLCDHCHYKENHE
jgi:hypothetical protein